MVFFEMEVVRTRFLAVSPITEYGIGGKMTGDKNFVLKGNICYSEDAKNLKLVEAGWLVCKGRAVPEFSRRCRRNMHRIR